MEKQHVQVEKEVIGNDIYHRVKDLPNLNNLNQMVKKIVQESSYWDRHGSTLFSIGLAIPLHLVGLYLCSYEIPMVFLAGFILLGLCHSVLVNRGAHLAAHMALFETPVLNRLARWLLGEVNGFFSLKVSLQAHVNEHHPYTNIIELGDSSSWKAPMFPRYIYMFIAPIALPLLGPVISLQMLDGQVLPTLSFLISISLGMAANLYLILKITGYTSVLYAVLFMFSYRAVTSQCFIHVNIFQHIGLPMFVREDRPSKIYQMSTGVLNLERNIILDWIMGHSLVFCHIEHHLFPRLSDGMCLKIRPTVKKFLLDHGLQYQEKPYMERLGLFLNQYEELMVKAPPFTHFVGLQ